MILSDETLLQQHDLRDQLQDAVDLQACPDAIPSALVGAILSSEIDSPTKKAGLGLLRSWVDYAQEQNVGSDPFAVRYHVTQFAAQKFGAERASQDLREVSLAEIGMSDA